MAKEFFFGKKVSPEEYVKKWKRELRREEHVLERSIREIDIAENKTKREIKKLAKTGDMSSARVLTREIVRSRRAKERLYNSKTQLSSVGMQLTENLAMMKVTGVMEKSAQVMHGMNQMVRLPQLRQTMMAMSREMTKAGMIEDMIDDVMDDPDIEDVADQEIENVLQEVTSDLLKTASNVPVGQLPVAAVENEKDKEIREKMEALKSI